jgi:hypothetical protein
MAASFKLKHTADDLGPDEAHEFKERITTSSPLFLGLILQFFVAAF